MTTGFLLIPLVVLTMSMTANLTEGQPSGAVAAEFYHRSTASYNFARESEHLILLCDAESKRDKLTDNNIDVIEIDPDTSIEEWRIIEALILRCAKVELTIWYNFGSLMLKLHPHEGRCRMDFRLAGELTETDRQHKFTCIGDPSIFSQLYLIHDGSSPRQMPSQKLQNILRSLCEETE